MGQPRIMRGSATIKPPLSDTLIETLTEDEALVGYFTVTEGGTPDSVEIIAGEVTVVEGDAAQELAFYWEEPGNFYDFEERCAELMKAAKKAGSKITGSFIIFGEENTDISRVRFAKSRIFDERPKLLWPNGEEEEL